MMFLPLAETMKLNEALSISGLGFVIVLIVLAVLAIFVMLLSKILKKSGKKADKKADATPVPAENSATVAPAPVVTAEKEQPAADFGGLIPVPGYVILDGVAEQDAAVIMAITSHKTGIDLNRLQFNSIKRLNQNPVLENIEEQDAAACMAITCNKLGVEPENLIFNSIKLVED